MDRTMLTIDPSATRLRRVGRLARRRMRIDGASLANGLHRDGTLTVRISGLGSPVAGLPESFEWEANRPIALVIVRSGIDGQDVAFQVGPSLFGTGRGAAVGDGTGIRYVAFCYDAPPDLVANVPSVVAAKAPIEPIEAPIAAAVRPTEGGRRRIAAAVALALTGRERHSILAQVLQDPVLRRATT